MSNKCRDMIIIYIRKNIKLQKGSYIISLERICQMIEIEFCDREVDDRRNDNFRVAPALFGRFNIDAVEDVIIRERKIEGITREITMRDCQA